MPTFLCLASYFKGNRFLERCKQEGCTVYLLTVEGTLKEPWARHACDDVFAVNNFHDRRGLINTVAYLMRSRRIDRFIALDDFVAEVNAYWRPLLDVYHGGGIYATRTFPRDRPEVAELRRANEHLLTGFGLDWGASHTEFMKAHADGQVYFIETSARVGGANTAEMVEHAAGVNLWGEWARLEMCRTEGGYELPPLKNRYGGVVTSLARQEK